MNTVSLIGRLVKDPEVSEKGQLTIARFTLAIDRPTKSDEADFPRVIAFGKTAELAGKYFKKGKLAGVVGHIQTGSYQKDGETVYTTDVIADRIDIIEWSKKKEPGDFDQVKADVPF